VKDSTVQLVGGLGNQLFGYFAGKYLEKVCGHKIRYLPSLQSDIFFSSRSSLRDLSVPEEEWFSPRKGEALKVLLQRQTLRLRKFMPRSISKGQTPLTPFGAFESEVIGFDPSLRKVRVGSLVHGYFQTYRYFDEVHGTDHPQLQLSQPSDWFIALSLRMQVENPVIIHARRGDYLNHATTIGVLDEEYYRQALSSISSNRSEATGVWLFSDDPTWAEKLARSLTGWQAEVISQPASSPAAEAMILMAQSSALVISNSTFSWWAAKLGGRKRVIAPNPWFVGQNEPTDLIPPSWERIDSVWALDFT
jgi:hypothetical protein